MLSKKNNLQSNKDHILSIILIVKNVDSLVKKELAILFPVLTKLPNYELLIIDNGSIDKTESIIKKYKSQIKNLRYLKLVKSYTLDIALSAGLENSIGDFVIFFDINSDPPAVIPILYKKALAGYDVVIGMPSNNPRISLPGKLLLQLNNFLLKAFIGINANYTGTHTRILRRKVVNSLLQIKNRGMYFKYFNYLGGYKQTVITYKLKKTEDFKYSRTRSYQYFFSTLEFIIANSNLPLRLTSLMCFIASFLNLAFIAYAFIVTIIKRQAPEGWLTTSFMNGFMFFLLFFILAIMSEYLVKVLNETKGQPSYFMSEEYDNNFSYYDKEQMNVV